MMLATPETWLFDLGNSRLKAARLAGGAPAHVLALDWQAAGMLDALRARLAGWPAPRRALVASVAAPARAALLRDALAGFAPGTVEWLRSPAAACGVHNRYAAPERLGIDRFLALVALRAGAGFGVIAGCGTALTLDALDAEGVNVDGLIALSPSRMLAALRGATAIAADNPDAFAEQPVDDSARALHAGCWGAAGALVEWFHARHPLAPHVWLHGGWAPQLAAWLERDGCPARALDHAVLRGLAVWASRGP